MKRKLLLSIFIIMFAFILNVKAEDYVRIKSVDLIEKSEAVKELEKPSFENLTLDLNLQLYKVGDYAKYKITIENLTDDAVKIINPGEKLSQDNEYIMYETNWNDESLIIDKNQSREYNLTVRYISSVAETEYTNNTYVKTDAFKIVVTQDENIAKTTTTTKKKKIKKQEESPQTSDEVIDYILLIIIAITLTFDIVYYAIIKKENKKFNKIILASSFILLLTSIILKITFALIYTELNINSTIKITKLPIMAERCYDKTYNQPHPPKPSYASNETDTEYCINWDDLTTIEDNEKFSNEENITVFNKLIVTTTSEMPEEYKFKGEIYTLEKTTDISAKQDNSVIAGSYKNNTNKNYLILIGGDGGVQAPENSPFLFSYFNGEVEHYNTYGSLDEYSKDNKILLSNTSSTPKKSKLMKYTDYMDLHNLDVSSAVNMDNIFSCDFHYHFDYINLSGWNAEKVTSLNGMFESSFQKNTGSVKLDFSTVKMPQLTSLDGMFKYTFTDSGNINFELTNINFENIESLSNMFSSFGQDSESINVKISNINTTKLKDTSNMFYYFGSGASKINLDLSNIDFSNVTNMYYMFSNAGDYFDTAPYGSYLHIKADSFNTEKVENMERIFGYMSSSTIYDQEIDLPDFSTNNVTNASEMFAGQSTTFINKILNNSNINTSKVENMEDMFRDIYSTEDGETLDLSKLNTSSVTDMSYMFYSSWTDNINLSSFDTSKVTNMDGMFEGYNGKKLDLSSFDTSNVANMSGMFENNNNLEIIYVGNKWNTSKVTSDYRMFYGCSKLKGGAGTTYNKSNTGLAYAHVDEGESNPGYLTLKSN